MLLRRATLDHALNFSHRAEIVLQINSDDLNERITVEYEKCAISR